MQLRQLRSLVTLVDCDFNVSRAAKALHLVQPAVSQHLKQMEEEVGARLFARHGTRLTGLTDIGETVTHYARKALADVGNILAVSQEHLGEERGVLRIASTHTQARYVLPPVIRRFRHAYPNVELHIQQGSPHQLVDMALQDTVDLAICTDIVDGYPALRALPCYRWNRCLIVPAGHPILEPDELSLEALCAHPLITYVFGMTGRGHFSDTFAAAGLHPKIVLGAADTDIIKTYVREGMGVGIITCLAYEYERDSDLHMRDLSHLFPWETTKIAFLRDKFLRGFQQKFIDIFQAETRYLMGS